MERRGAGTLALAAAGPSDDAVACDAAVTATDAAAAAAVADDAMLAEYSRRHCSCGPQSEDPEAPA